jgi:peptide/nickel transport system substrate-binding protein
MLGWGEATFDSGGIFNFLVHTTTDDRGAWNGTGYDNSALNAKIISLESEVDLDKRSATINEIWEQVQEDQIYLALHNQVLNWGMKDSIQFGVQPENAPHIKYMELR